MPTNYDTERTSWREERVRERHAPSGAARTSNRIPRMLNRKPRQGAVAKQGWWLRKRRIPQPSALPAPHAGPASQRALRGSPARRPAALSAPTPLTLVVLHHADGAARVDNQHPRLGLRASAAARALLGPGAG